MVRHSHASKGGSRRQIPKHKSVDVIEESSDIVKQSDVIEMEGRVLDILGFGNYSVKLDDVEMVVTAYSSGKMNKNNISIIIGDKVKVELNMLDPTKGRIVYRQK